MYNILVVDDERIHREGLIMLLEKICPDDMLWEASNGQEAMEIMNNISCENFGMTFFLVSIKTCN